MFSKAERSKDLTLIFHGQDGIIMAFLLGQHGWGLILGRSDAANTSASQAVCARHPPGVLLECGRSGVGPVGPEGLHGQQVLRQ